MSFIEREYQTNAETGIFKAWETNQSTLLELATGLGKTHVACNVIKRVFPKRALFLCHQEELVVQAHEAISKSTGFNVDVEQAGLYASTNYLHRAQAVVSTIQSQNSGPKDAKRYKRFKPEDFGLLIVDECHHGTADSWKEVIRYYLQNPNCKMLGLSATPKRGDGKALGDIIESVAFQYGIREGIIDGWLVNIGQLYVVVNGLDFSHIETVAGDFNKTQLSELVEREENVQGLCQPTLEAIHGLEPKALDGIPVDQWREHLKKNIRTESGKPRRTLVFTVSVAQAEMCASVFGRAMDGVEWVCGATNKDDRKEIRERFFKGETHVVANCGVYLEGYNNPFVELISVSRPTKSLNLYTQMLGRGTRTLPGIVDGLATPDERKSAIKQSTKKLLRVLDFAGNSGRHKLVSSYDVLGGHTSDEAKERAKENAIKDGTVKMVTISISNAELELEKKKREDEERRRKAREAEKVRALARSKFSMKDVSAFESNHGAIPLHARTCKDNQCVTEPQARVLRENGHDPAKYTHSQCRAIIGKILSKPSEPQLNLLHKHNYDTTGWDRKRCKKEIEALKNNGWKKPTPA